MRILIFILLMAGCAHEFVEVRYEPNKILWIGRNSDEILLHPEFASLQMERRQASNGDEMITFKNKGMDNSSINCVSNMYGFTSCGGGTKEIVCNHQFLVKTGKISDYQRMGNCTAEEELRFRPRTLAGNPLMTDTEVALIEKKNKLEQRECNFFGRLIKSQGCQ